MVEAKDLRLGNYIIDGFDFIKVDIDVIKCAESGRCEFDSIKLTEDILLKCGFESIEQIGRTFIQREGVYTIGYDRVKKQKGYSVKVTDGRFFLAKGNTGVRSYQLMEIHNLHQLQNLIFSLTDKELEVNL